jgi:superfamily II DNA or RNA helicase
VSWRGTLIQYTGRLHRLHPGKRDVRIFDYVDRDVPTLLRMFKSGFVAIAPSAMLVGEAPLGYREPPEVTIEYDTDRDDDAPD